MEPCVAPLWAWGVAPWEGTHWALALEATTLGSRWSGVAISVVSRGWALPVAWTVLEATAPHAWRREWWRMVRQGRRAVPRTWTVMVLADRGLDARWRCRRSTRLGWPPFVRSNTGGTLRPPGHVRGGALKTLVPQPGTAWQGPGIAGKGRAPQRPCPLLAWWEAGEQAPWVLLTALPPEAGSAGWSGLRAWMAQGVTITTRAGWQWQRTPMPKPARAARLWVAVAVAPLWLLRVGGEAQETMPASTVPDMPTLGPQPPRTRRATRLRLVRVFRRGWHLILVALRDHAPLPLGRVMPEPWPAVPVPEEAMPSLPGLALAPRRLRPQAARATETCMRGTIWT